MSDHDDKVQRTVIVEMTKTQMRACCEDLLAAMNKAQYEKGFTIDEVLMATAFLLGTSIKQRGGKLLLDAPLRRALPPLVAGYEAAVRRTA
jgi:hypothetical protein